MEQTSSQNWFWPKWSCSWIRATQLSRSGPPQHRNWESCGGKNVQARIPHSVNLTGKNKCSSVGQTRQMESDLKQGVFENLSGLIIEHSSAGQTRQMESDLKQGVFEDLPGLIIERSSASQTRQMGERSIINPGRSSNTPCFKSLSICLVWLAEERSIINPGRSSNTPCFKSLSICLVWPAEEHLFLPVKLTECGMRACTFFPPQLSQFRCCGGPERDN